MNSGYNSAQKKELDENQGLEIADESRKVLPQLVRCWVYPPEAAKARHKKSCKAATGFWAKPQQAAKKSKFPVASQKLSAISVLRFGCEQPGLKKNGGHPNHFAAPADKVMAALGPSL